MSFIGRAGLVMWFDVEREVQNDFLLWHDREHMPERLGVPGILIGRRYSSIDADRQYFVSYDLESTAVLKSEAYEECLANPTPWSNKVLAGFRGNVRGVCDVRFSSSITGGSYIETLRINAAPSAETMRDAAVFLERLARDTSLTGVSILQCDPSSSGTDNPLQRSRQIEIPSLVVTLDAACPLALEAVSDDIRAWAETTFRGEAAGGLYRLDSQLTCIGRPHVRSKT